MAAPVAVLTFSYLIIDGFLPVENAQGTRISFADRERLVVDECHKLEDQVASLHAGIAISPFSLPDEVHAQVDRDIGELPGDEVIEFIDVREHTDRVLDRAEAFIEREGSTMAGVEESRDVRECRAFVRKYEWCKGQVQRGRDWVVGRVELIYDDARRYPVRIQLVDVDRFLQDHVWSRADKRVLSTATMPFSDTPDRWLERLGLVPDDAAMIQYPMPFPVERRPVHTGCAVGKMSQGGYDAQKTKVFETLKTLLYRHAGENGSIHTASYERAEELHERFPKRSLLHDNQADGDLRAQMDDYNVYVRVDDCHPHHRREGEPPARVAEYIPGRPLRERTGGPSHSSPLRTCSA